MTPVSRNQDALQRCLSAQRQAYVTATTLRRLFSRLSMHIPITRMADVTQVLARIDLLIAQLSPQDGGA